MLKQALAIAYTAFIAVIFMCIFPPSTPGAYVLGFVICAAYGSAIWLMNLHQRS